MEKDEPHREQGVDFSSIDPVLEDLPYPVTADELVAEYGDHTIERTNAEPISIGDLLGPLDDTYESDDEVRQSILNLMPRDSVGRSEYSDRGGSLPEEEAQTDEDDSI